MDLESSVRRVIDEEGLVDAGDRILVGVSGGMDSSTLLFLLNRIKDDIPISLAVAHVNHQLRGPESLRDEEFVRGLAERLSVPFHTARIDIRAESRQSGLSVQHAGRDARYRFFRQLAEAFGYRKIAVAHNRDDQVETFLLRVVKGSGLNGLASIPIKRGPIIRPLLRAYRSEIAEYAAQHDLPYVEDSSNSSDKYERNFVRHRIVPLLEQLNPRFREKVLLLLSDIVSVNTVFDDEAARFLNGQGLVDEEEAGVGVDALKSLHEEVRFRVVSRLFARLDPRFVALREHILLVDKSLFSNRPNNSVTLPHGIRVKRVYGRLVFTRKAAEAPAMEIVGVRAGENSIASLGLTLDVSFVSERPVSFPTDRMVSFFDAEGISDLTVRTFREGDRFVPLGMAREVKLKDYFISRKIPREERRHIPLLLSDQQIIWVVGERIDGRYKVTEKTQRFLRVAARFHS